jgi:hypothetical protein
MRLWPSSVSFANSYVAPLALLGTILVACAHARTAHRLTWLRRTEEEYRADHRWERVPSNGNVLGRIRARPGTRDKEQRGNV